ncbi:UNVERIFIED_ORG: hypothetical protein ABIB19_003183 [Arthrobacter sp. UYEF10]
MLTGAWHMLATGELYKDPGADYFTRRAPAKTKARAIGQLEALGCKVAIEPLTATGYMPTRTACPVPRAAIAGAAALLELVNDWAMELNDPEGVEKLARKRGLDLNSFTELRQHDLKVCDRLLKCNTLTWRTAGALEGGTMGVLALTPVAGIPVAMTADILVIQVLSTSIASRIADRVLLRLRRKSPQ